MLLALFRSDIRDHVKIFAGVLEIPFASLAKFAKQSFQGAAGVTW